MTGTITQDGKVLVWVARYMRHFSEGSQGCPSLEVAVQMLMWGQEDSWCSPGAIVCPDGRRIEGDELRSLLDEAWDRWAAECDARAAAVAKEITP